MQIVKKCRQNYNHLPEHLHRNHRGKRPRQMVFDASIEVSRCGNCLCAAVTIFHRRHRVDHALLTLNNCTDEKAWYRAYQTAQNLVDKHCLGARLFIREQINNTKVMRRAA